LYAHFITWDAVCIEELRLWALVYKQELVWWLSEIKVFQFIKTSGCRCKEQRSV